MSKPARDERFLWNLLGRRRRRAPRGTTRTILPLDGGQPSEPKTPRSGPAGDELRVRALLRRLTGGGR
jgi:hypothetical protein